MIECIICSNKTFNLKFHYLKKPKKETDFKINKKKYERFYIECKKCLHLFSLMSFDLNNLYSKNYSKLTYGKKILKIFHKINNLPNHKSDTIHKDLESLFEYNPPVHNNEPKLRIEFMNQANLLSNSTLCGQ